VASDKAILPEQERKSTKEKKTKEIVNAAPQYRPKQAV
jgi:hypothetical protein